MKSAPLRRKLTHLLIQRLRPAARAYLVWDTYQRNLALRIQPTGHRAWKCIYHANRRVRWLHLGDARAIHLAQARELAAQTMFAVAKGGDPAAERRAARGKGTFEELAKRYVDEYAKKQNKSWQQADYLVQRHLLPVWGKLQAPAITRADVKATMARITAPIVANQVLAAASAIFTWGMKQDVVHGNPCRGVDRNPTQSRERVLTDSEIAKFWAAFDDVFVGDALKVVLLTGQRPGEVAHMRREHIEAGWWTLPGKPCPGWPGTKNGATHQIWLAAPVRSLLDGEATDFIFASARGNALPTAMRQLCATLGVARATPHDLRRTFSSRVTGLGFGREAMNRVTNHKDGGIASVYDRHGYAEENKRIMEAVAAHIVGLAQGHTAAGNVVQLHGKT